MAIDKSGWREYYCPNCGVGYFGVPRINCIRCNGLLYRKCSPWHDRDSCSECGFHVDAWDGRYYRYWGLCPRCTGTSLDEVCLEISRELYVRLRSERMLVEKGYIKEVR